MVFTCVASQEDTVVTALEFDRIRRNRLRASPFGLAVSDRVSQPVLVAGLVVRQRRACLSICQEEDVVGLVDDSAAGQSTPDLEQGQAGQAERHADREELVILVYRMRRFRPLQRSFESGSGGVV